MRIRGYDEETEEYVGGVEQLSGDIADLTKTANNMSGISLFTDESKTEYKSTTQLLRDISEIYDELTDKQQANLLEKLAGKRQGQIVAAILNNFDAVDKSLNTMKNSAGNALNEMSIIEESVEYKLNSLKESATGLFQNIFKTKDMGAIISSAQTFLDIVNNIVKTTGALPPILAVIAGYLSASKNIGRDKRFSLNSSNMPIVVIVLFGYRQFRYYRLLKYNMVNEI